MALVLRLSLYQVVTVLGTCPRHVLFPRRGVAGVSTLCKAGFYPGKKVQGTSLAHPHPAVCCPGDQAFGSEEGRKPSKERKKIDFGEMLLLGAGSFKCSIGEHSCSWSLGFPISQGSPLYHPSRLGFLILPHEPVPSEADSAIFTS